MGDIELKHSRKGSTWQKTDHKYVSRKKVNGKWVYTYEKPYKGPTNRTITNDDANIAQNFANLRYIDKNIAQRRRSEAEISKRMASSAQNNIQKSKLYKTHTKLATYKNKVGRNIFKGKKKVAELLDRLQKKYEDEKRRYAGKKAGRKSAKLSRERQKRLKQKNTIKLNKHQRVTFSDVKIR